VTIGIRLVLLVPVAFGAALQASAAELTFQRFVAPGGSVLARRTVLSPDARHLYALNASASGGIAVYERDRTTGSLGFVEDLVEGPGDLSAFTAPLEAIVTPDGAFVVVAAVGALYVFQRDAADGALTFVERETGGYGGLPITSTALTQSSDGAHVYAGTHSGRIFLYSREATTGALTYVESMDDFASPARHFDQIRALGVSPDGAFVYASSSEEDAITVFDRNPTTGELVWLGDAALTTDPGSLAFSPDGMRLFAGGLQSGGAARMVVYARDAATGAITGIGSTLVAAITLGFIRWKGARE
jgi:6-phosphogluconolactonase (cycloisomerase 2 family)